MSDGEANRKILLVSHGKIAEAMAYAATLIMGGTDAVDSLCLEENESLESFIARIEEKTSEKREYIVLADLMSGTPFNAAFVVKQKKDHFEIIVGFNLTVLLSLINDMDASFDQAIENAVSLGKEMIFQIRLENMSKLD